MSPEEATIKIARILRTDILLSTNEDVFCLVKEWGNDGSITTKEYTKKDWEDYLVSTVSEVIGHKRAARMLFASEPIVEVCKYLQERAKEAGYEY